jgi:hypothetical protein
VHEAPLVVTRISPVPLELETLDNVAWAEAVQAPEPVCITVNVFVAIVTLAVRCEKLKGGAEIVSVRDPLRDEYGPRFPSVSHGALEEAVQVQALGNTTLMFWAIPVESNCSGSGDTTG